MFPCGTFPIISRKNVTNVQKRYPKPSGKIIRIVFYISCFVATITDKRSLPTIASSTFFTNTP